MSLFVTLHEKMTKNKIICIPRLLCNDIVGSREIQHIYNYLYHSYQQLQQYITFLVKHLGHLGHNGFTVYSYLFIGIQETWWKLIKPLRSRDRSKPSGNTFLFLGTRLQLQTPSRKDLRLEKISKKLMEVDEIHKLENIWRWIFWLTVP